MKNGMTVADYIVRQMQLWDIDTVFGVPGDTVLPLLEALRAAGTPRFIVCRNAESAALMGSAYGKVTGKAAACVADAGPGAVQMLNGVFDARMDRVPLLAIVGEDSFEQPTRTPSVQTNSLYRSATVYNETLSGASQTPRVFGEALRRMSLQGRPVRLGVPKDLWNDNVSDVRFSEVPNGGEYGAEVRTNERVLRRAAELLGRAERPVLFAGIGASRAVPELLRLAEALQAPIVHSLPAAGIVPRDNPWNLGVIGKFGTQAAADVFGRADVILAVGTTWWESQFAADDVKVIQIDLVREHLGLTFPVDIGVWGDATRALQALADGAEPTGREEWVRFVRQARFTLEAEWNSMEHRTDAPLEPGAVIAAVGRALVPDAIVSVDVGNNTFWFSRYMQGPDMKVLLSGHWRTAGFGLPGAVAAKLAEPHRQVVMVGGEGGFGMTMSELLTAVQYNLPIVCVVLSDGRYGEEATRQEAHGQSPFGTDLYEPDWAAFARACGAVGYTVNTYDELQGALHDALPALARGQISVLHVHVARVAPMHPQSWRTAQQWVETGDMSVVPNGSTVNASRIEAGVPQ